MSVPRRDTQPRILLAADAYMPWSGGSRVYYHNLYSRLASAHGYDVNVVTTHTAGDASFDAASVSAALRIDRHGSPLPDWKVKRLPACAGYAARLAWKLATTRPAALHCGDLAPQSLAAWALHQATRVPYLVFVHGDEIAQTDRRRHQPKLRDAIYRDAHTLVAANPFALARLQHILGGTEKCHLLLPGVDLEHFYPSATPSPLRQAFLRDGPGSMQSGPVLLTTGRLVPRKGHAQLLEVLPALVREFPALQYVVAGDGPERARLETLTERLGVARHVRFLGDVPHAQLGDVYRAADLFVLPNRVEAGGDLESFGMVFIEANACGLPVVGGRSGGTDAAVVHGSTGLLCDVACEDQLAATILTLLRNPQRAQAMGRAGCKRARQDFQWDDRAAALAGITEQMRFETQRAGNRVRRAGGTA